MHYLESKKELPGYLKVNLLDLKLTYVNFSAATQINFSFETLSLKLKILLQDFTISLFKLSKDSWHF